MRHGSNTDDRENRDGLKYSPTEKAVVDRIRSIPRVRPSRSLRLRVIAHTMFITLRRSPAVEPRSSDAVTRRSRPSVYLRYAACISLALIVALSLFFGFSALARDTKPGDTLYFMKRVGERVDLAFTLNDTGRARKNLAFAERRLAELEQLISEKEIKPAKIAYLAEEYESNRRAVNNYLESLAWKSRVNLANELEELEEQETVLARKIESQAGAGGAMEPAASAAITVRDSSGEGILNGRSTITGKTDPDGMFRFDLEVGEAGDLESLETVIEADGRKQWSPLVAGDGEGETRNGAYRIEAHPVMTMVESGSAARFTLKLQADDTDSIGDRLLRVRDSAGDAKIAGKRGYATVRTDSSGRCSFELEKTSPRRMSRIEVEINENGMWESFGEILALGTLEFDDSRAANRGIANEGFDVKCSPNLENLSKGSYRVTLTIRKKYAKITDYVK